METVKCSLKKKTRNHLLSKCYKTELKSSQKTYKKYQRLCKNFYISSRNKNAMKIHFYGQPSFTNLPKGTTTQDLRSLAHFNRIMKNYAKLCRIEKTGKP